MGDLASKPEGVLCSLLRLIYASAQKNLGISGLCVVIVSKELLGRTNDNVPRLYDYNLCANEASLTNTPPTFAIYVLARLLNWVNNAGGVDKMHSKGEQNATRIYDAIDASQIYISKVQREFRSKINLTFSIQDSKLQSRFLEQARLANLVGLRGHKTAGGVRVSLYNAIPQAGIDALVKFMQEFESSF